jgi:excisionase family DNA binding protein
MSASAVGVCSGRGDAGRWLKPQELADLLGMSKYWVQERVTAKALPHHRVGRNTRFCPECVTRIQRSTAVAPADRPAPLRRTG